MAHVMVSGLDVLAPASFLTGVDQSIRQVEGKRHWQEHGQRKDLP